MKQDISPESPGQPAGRRDVAVAALLAAGALIEGLRLNRGGAHRAWLAAVPIVIVNYVAFRAQLRFWQANLSRDDAFLVSVALESIAIYLAWQAHLARLANDAALRLRLAAYGIALVIGALNYSHYMKPGWIPTVAAATFGLMSAVSPWLWSVHSRRVNRDELKARDEIEDHAVRLGATRWFWHPWRSALVMWQATWLGVNRLAEAIALYQPRQGRKPASKPAPASQPVDPEPAPASQPEPLPAPQSQPASQPEPPPSVPVREPRSSGTRAARTGLATARDDAERKLIRELVAGGPELPSERALAADRLAGSRARAVRILKAARAEMGGGSGVRVNGS